jgi:ABC-2 type transport system ATP-binding protein
VTRRFGDFLAVDEVNLAVRGGEIVGLLGPNGAGKTTTVKMLMGMLRQTSGELLLLGQDAFHQRHEVQRHVGYLPDEPQFQSHLRGIELLEFVASVRSLPPDSVRAHVDSIGAKLGLTEDLGDFAANYSQGMRKKLAFLMATLHRPKLLIMDEPTNGLDPVATRSFLEVLTGLVATGTGVLYSTHLLDQAEKVCDRCVVMNRGRIVASGSVAELKAASGVASLEAVFFAVTGGAEARHA